jgi:hypothetical protein
MSKTAEVAIGSNTRQTLGKLHVYACFILALIAVLLTWTDTI